MNLRWILGRAGENTVGQCHAIKPVYNPSPVYFSAFMGGLLYFIVVLPAASQDNYPGTPGSGLETVPQNFDNKCKFSREPVVSEPADSNALAPKIFNSSIEARGGDVIFFQGANLTPSARILLDIPGGGSTQIPIVNRADSWLSAQIPGSVSGTFSVRILNEFGTSSAIRINAPIPYHLDATQIVPGAHLRIFGRNLVYATCAPRVFIGGYSADVDVVSSRDYMLDVRAPLGIIPVDAAEVLVDNGGGIGPTALDGGVRVVAGSGDPLNLSVGWAALFDFATRVITSSAKCDGMTDDTAAIKRAISSASALGGATVQLPKGTCRVAGTIDFESKAVLRGVGRNETILRYEANYPISAVSKDRIGLEDLQLLNAGATQEGMIWRENSLSFIRRVTINMIVSRQWFFTDNRDFLFDNNSIVQTGSYDQQNPYRFDRCAGLLFSNNHSINVNGSPTFQEMRNSAFINNQFTRDAISQNEDPVIAHHGFVMDFAQRVSIIGNAFDVVNGPILNRQRNDGETILVEGGGPNRTESLGVIKAADTNSLVDQGNAFKAESSRYRRNLNFGVAIVSGNGSGQTRHVVSYDGGRLKVDYSWDVTPEAGSHYAAFVWGLEKVLIIENTFVGNPRGIWLYQTSMRDVVIKRNDFRDGGGIYLRSYQDVASGLFTIQLNTVIEENTVINRTGEWMSHIIMVCVSAQDTTFGIGQLGIEVRRNRLIANRPNLSSTKEDYAAREGFAAFVRVEASHPQPKFSPRLIGPIFQDNACVNCERPYTVGVGVTGAVFFGNTPASTTDRSAVTDLDIADRPLGGSIGTVAR